MNKQLRARLAQWLNGNSPPVICGADSALTVFDAMLKANGLRVVPIKKEEEPKA